VLSGAGISTESGIPDYRGPNAKPRNPMRYQMFVNSAVARQRYWARSTVGWAFVAERHPNTGHQAVQQLEAAGFLTGVLTQNVDGLHQAAGSPKVLELHGRLSQVRCLQCQRLEHRAHLQKRLLEHNPSFKTYVVDVAPDGDAEIPDEHIHTFTVPACQHCAGVLKPDVVFFGENVPKPRVERAWQYLDEADTLLVLGSSLTVRSGYRFVVRAVQEKKPVTIINLGETRGDGDATLKLDAPLGITLQQLVSQLGC
jgi:NAD-dependent SIR2 family protein deacetylase